MINYDILHKASEYYESNKYSRIETPWAVSEEVDNITKPAGRTSFQLKHNDKCLVASGEQAFLYQYLKEYLPLGQYHTITPCFRFENFDFLHQKYFMKLELIKTDKVDKDELFAITKMAHEFFAQHFDRKLLSLVSTGQYDESWDIMLDTKYELGSYGIRKWKNITWIYGTGVAEPRTSNLIKLYEGQVS